MESRVEACERLADGVVAEANDIPDIEDRRDEPRDAEEAELSRLLY